MKGFEGKVALVTGASRGIGEVDDVAGTIAFLCSDDARHVTGHFLTVDGGMIGY